MRYQKFDFRALLIIGAFIGLVTLGLVIHELWPMISLLYEICCVSHETPKEDLGIPSTDPITLKLWDDYRIDIPQNYIKFRKDVLHPEQNATHLRFWAIYPTFEGYTDANSAIFKNEHRDDNVVDVEMFRFPYKPHAGQQWDMKHRGIAGLNGILEAHKNFMPTPKDKQPFSNPIEYARKNGSGYFYIYDSGDRVTFVRCRYFSIRDTIHPSRCKAEGMWSESISITYNFGISNLGNFGIIEREVLNKIESFNLRRITHE